MMLRKAASRTTESTQFLRENLMSMSESLRISVKYSGGFKQPAFIGTGGQNAPIAIRENVSEIVVTDSWWVVGVTIAAPLSSLYTEDHPAADFCDHRGADRRRLLL
jgi:hypothetical protein